MQEPQAPNASGIVPNRCNRTETVVKTDSTSQREGSLAPTSLSQSPELSDEVLEPSKRIGKIARGCRLGAGRFESGTTLSAKPLFDRPPVTRPSGSVSSPNDVPTRASRPVGPSGAGSPWGCRAARSRTRGQGQSSRSPAEAAFRPASELSGSPIPDGRQRKPKGTSLATFRPAHCAGEHHSQNALGHASDPRPRDRALSL